MNANAKSPAILENEVMLTILSGVEAGVAYKLIGETVTIGRDTTNDVILPDTKSSRNHACIELRNGDFWIRDLGSQNGLIINGTVMRESLLRFGDQLIIGSTIMRFGPPTGLSLVQRAPPIPLASGFSPTSGSLSSQTHGVQKPNFLYAFIGILIVVGVFFQMRQTATQKREYKIYDESAIDSEIEDISHSNETRQQEILKKGKGTQQYSEAQGFYQRGFREFREGNFSRATQNFEAALALYPEHPLAKRYLERSHLKLNELVTEYLTRGERNFQQERYQAAFSDYKTVILLKNDPRDKTYQLAQKRIEAINLIWTNSK